MQDTILTTAGGPCGLSGAVWQRNQVIIAARAAGAVGALVRLLPSAFITTPLAGLTAAVVVGANLRSAVIGAALAGNVIGLGIAKPGGWSSAPLP